ncbi:DNA-binding transcriptional regulator, AcrR family [Actinomyces ruminicola]|uniref:DNA-binding transcriptional regulator, AcrR family n=1 Tax=Actinomyces ruminicola TaxID=332524 RepID=A0A1H0EMW5_9ACTO|nr:TetR/AcrR family transcriptional regulator [Actinomyces ruminicola]SDN83787.1 DNA-binding transcriptional regulator, AcrR family [Actinomyces ruminicola]
MPKIMGNSLSEHRERTRHALFDALSELLSQRPFDKITLSDVAARAGVGRTAVYNHFTDKEDLLLAFMEHETGRYAKELTRILAEVADPIDRLRIYVRQQALLKRHYHFPATGPLARSVSHDTAGRLHAHAGHMTRMLTQILTDAMDAEAIPRQDPALLIPLIHACILGGRPTPTEPHARAAYLQSLDVFVLRAVGAPTPSHAVPAVPPTHSTEPASRSVRAAG